MKHPLAVTNALLTIIAVCLCLLVLKLHDVDLVAEAHATPGDTTPMRVQVVNDELPCTIEDPVDARIHFHDGGSWSPVRGDYRGLVVRPQE